MKIQYQPPLRSLTTTIVTLFSVVTGHRPCRWGKCDPPPPCSRAPHPVRFANMWGSLKKSDPAINKKTVATGRTELSFGSVLVDWCGIATSMGDLRCLMRSRWKSPCFLASSWVQIPCFLFQHNTTKTHNVSSKMSKWNKSTLKKRNNFYLMKVSKKRNQYHPHSNCLVSQLVFLGRKLGLRGGQLGVAPFDGALKLLMGRRKWGFGKAMSFG